MDLIIPSAGLVFWQLFGFLALLFILIKFAWKPILASLAEREASIDNALKAAEKVTRDQERKRTEKLIREKQRKARKEEEQQVIDLKAEF